MSPDFPLLFEINWSVAALSISNNIAEGFERVTTAELLSFLAIARGSAGEVRSMLLVIKTRPATQHLATTLDQILELARSCQRQLTAWITAPFKEKGT